MPCRPQLRAPARSALCPRRPDPAASLAQVGPLYALEKEGGFRKGNQRGIDFATAGLALGAQFTRDMIYDAWQASADVPVGYPMVNVRRRKLRTDVG
jgi:hypothetical protein